VSAVDLECETAVSAAAQALEDLTTLTAHRVASETRWRAAGAAIAAKQAASAMSVLTAAPDE
jgi:hypothetical protein